MSHKVFRVIRTILLKIAYGKRITIKKYPDFSNSTKIKIYKNGKIVLGKGITAFNNVHFSAVDGKLEVGDSTSFNRNCIIVSRESIKIGEKCFFGPNVCIYDHDHVFDIEGVKIQYKTGPIVIEDNCWIGANAVILRGTHIGKGCVIGAGTIIKGDIPPHSIVMSDRKLSIKPIRVEE